MFPRMEAISSLSDESIVHLQDLIDINIDSEKGLRRAAQAIDDPEIAALFRQCADERRVHARELRVHVPFYEPSGSLRGTLHRWWLDLRGSVCRAQAHAILAEAERGEDAIKARYESMLARGLGSTLQTQVERQYVEVKSRHDLIRALRDLRAE